MISLDAVLSGDKRPEGEVEEGGERRRHGALPLLFSVREAGRERVLKRCGWVEWVGGMNGTS